MVTTGEMQGRAEPSLVILECGGSKLAAPTCNYSFRNPVATRIIKECLCNSLTLFIWQRIILYEPGEMAYNCQNETVLVQGRRQEPDQVHFQAFQWSRDRGQRPRFCGPDPLIIPLLTRLAARFIPLYVASQVWPEEQFPSTI